MKLGLVVIRTVLQMALWGLRAAWSVLKLLIISMVSFWRGIPATTGTIANTWLDRAIHAGFPTRWDRDLYRVLRVVAAGMIVVGWIIASYITIWIVYILLNNQYAAWVLACIGNLLFWAVVIYIAYWWIRLANKT